jgi:hypothetical protein
MFSIKPTNAQLNNIIDRATEYLAARRALLLVDPYSRDPTRDVMCRVLKSDSFILIQAWENLSIIWC